MITNAFPRGSAHASPRPSYAPQHYTHLLAKHVRMSHPINTMLHKLIITDAKSLPFPSVITTTSATLIPVMLLIRTNAALTSSHPSFPSWESTTTTARLSSTISVQTSVDRP